MRNASHPFLLASKLLSRNAYKYWKALSRQPLVRRVQSTLIWLPTLTVFAQVGYTIRAVTGNSMQVRSTHSPTATPPLGILLLLKHLSPSPFSFLLSPFVLFAEKHLPA